eukprot:SAG31_NODE_1558_length_7885_cov_2.567300_11_plen_168_part_00
MVAWRRRLATLHRLYLGLWCQSCYSSSHQRFCDKLRLTLRSADSSRADAVALTHSGLSSSTHLYRSGAEVASKCGCARARKDSAPAWVARRCHGCPSWRCVPVDAGRRGKLCQCVGRPAGPEQCLRQQLPDLYSALAGLDEAKHRMQGLCRLCMLVGCTQLCRCFHQ